MFQDLSELLKTFCQWLFMFWLDYWQMLAAKWVRYKSNGEFISTLLTPNYAHKNIAKSKGADKSMSNP